MSAAVVRDFFALWALHIMSALFTVFIFRATYLIYLHPLSKYPGPFLAKITDGYGAYSALRKRLHLDTHINVQKYGNVIRQGPNKLVFNSPRAAEDIYLSPRAAKSNAYDGAAMGNPQRNLINLQDRELHRRKRRIIGPVLGDRYLRGFEPIMSAHIDTFLRQILSSSERNITVDISPASQRLSADIIASLAFGNTLNMQTTEKYYHLPKYSMTCPGGSASLAFKNALVSLITTRMALGKDIRYDLYSAAKGADDAGVDGIIVDHDLWPEAALFVLAGGGPTSAALSAVFFYLSRNPQCYNKLAHEIRTSFASAGQIAPGSLLSRCTYLKACIDESMRMSPPSMSFPWRIQDPMDNSGQPWIVDGHIIPRGTQVAVHVYPLFHDEEIFPDSFAFKPERWLDPAPGNTENTMATRKLTRRAFAPFSSGDRACPAKSLSLMELNVTIARTLWYFDFEIAPGPEGELGGGTSGRTDGRGRPDEYQLDDIFYSAHRGPNLVFKEREGYAEYLRATGVKE